MSCNALSVAAGAAANCGDDDDSSNSGFQFNLLVLVLEVSLLFHEMPVSLPLCHSRGRTALVGGCGAFVAYLAFC